MAAANTDLSKDIPRQLELLFGIASGATPAHTGFLVGVTAGVTTPSNAAANTLATATATVTGAKVGDFVLAFAPTTALPAGQQITNAYVTAADTITIIFDSTAAVTGASRTFNYLVSKRS